MSKLYVLGAGGHGKVVAEAASLCGYEAIAFLDDTKWCASETGTLLGGAPLGYPIEGPLSRIREVEPCAAVVAIGDAVLRLRFLGELADLGWETPAILHPRATFSAHASIGPGSVVMAGAAVNPGAQIGNGCILNTCCSVDHDCVLDRGVHISPGAHLGGGVHIGAGTWVCTGASVSHGIRIGEGSTVAAGAAVVADVPDNVLVAGVPAVVKKRY